MSAATGGHTPFDRARQIADAVLLEGYVLYPYRASSTKNRYRFTFGVLAPRAWSEVGGCEPWWMETQCLVERSAGQRSELDGKLRFLQVCRRCVQRTYDGGRTFQAVDSFEVDGRRLVTWDEGELREIDFQLALEDAAGLPVTVAFELPGGREEELIRDGDRAVARVVRERQRVRGDIIVGAEAIAASAPLTRVSVRVRNETSWHDERASRDEVLLASCVASHLVLAITGASFLSSLDPPEWAATAARTCRNTRTFPVLAGEPGRGDLLLAAPIILYDHPQIAPESPGELFDATEIDEILTLRTATLTEEEKRDARATDARAAAIIDRVDGLPPELLARLHGAARDVRGAEMIPRAIAPASAVPGVDAGDAKIGPGSRVRLRPGVRRTDAQDLLYAGCSATVHLVRRDVDGRDCLAVTIDDDPAAELHEWYGRYHHFYLDEVEPLEPGAAHRGDAP